MGWMRTFFLGDLGNRLDIADTEDSIERLRTYLREKAVRERARDDRIEDLERENDQLKLFLTSLTDRLIARGVVTREEVARFVEVIEA